MTKIEYKTNFKDYLVFAHEDLDGLFSAFTVKHLFDNSVQGIEGWDMNVKTLFIEDKITLDDMLECIAGWLEETSESLAKGKVVIVVGNLIKIEPKDGKSFTYELFKTMKALKAVNVSFSWYSNDFEPAEIDSMKNIDGSRQCDKLTSNAHLVWSSLVGSDLNSYIKAIDDICTCNADIDKDYYSKLKCFTKMIECFDYSSINDPKSELVKELESLFNAKAFPESFDFRTGEAICCWTDAFSKKLKQSVYNISFAGLNCLVVNSQNKDMSFFRDNFTADELKGIDMFIIWSYDGIKYTYSLASNGDEFKLIDIGKICRERLNGNGSKTSGFGFTDTLIEDEFKTGLQDNAEAANVEQ